MRRGSLVLIVLLAAFAAAPAGAAASTTFGANLDRAPNSTTTCVSAQIFVVATTCSAESIDLATAESNFPPAGEGTVSRVRVRIGPVTGPMQIVEEEALRQDNPADPGHPTYACCKAVDASAVFTPAANSITTVNVNFHVKQDLAPEASGYYVDDHLSLSVLDPNVPIPANLDPNASDGLWFPAWQVGQERAGIFGAAGAVVLFNADWSANGGGGGGGQPVTLANKTAGVKNGNALVNLLCRLAVPCAGQLRLQDVQARVAMLSAPRKGRSTTYASVKFKIPAGKKKAIKAPLNGAGKRLLVHRKKAKVWATISPAGGGAAFPPTQITLKK